MFDFYLNKKLEFCNSINDIKLQYVYYANEFIPLLNVYHIIFFLISRNKFKK